MIFASPLLKAANVYLLIIYVSAPGSPQKLSEVGHKASLKVAA